MDKDKTVIQKFFERFDDEETRVMRKARQEVEKEAKETYPKKRGVEESVRSLYRTEEENKGGAGQKKKKRISQLDLWG